MKDDNSPSGLLERFQECCLKQGLRVTEQRRLIIKTLSKMDGHPNVSELYLKVQGLNPRISLGTVYRTMGLLERYNLIERREFGISQKSGQKGARFEDASMKHHDHLIDINTGEVVEFQEDNIEKLQKEVAHRMGYELKGHKLELYAVKKGGNRDEK